MKVENCIKFLMIIFIQVFATQVNSQDIEIYETDQFGFKNITPSIIIDENTFTGNFEVYSVNRFGLKNILPNEIIENDEFSGTQKIYRVNNLGLKDILPKLIGQENSFTGNYEIYDVNDIGFKNILPSTILENNTISGEIEIYDVDEFGLKEVFPIEVIKKENDKINVYSVNNIGLVDFEPKRIIEIKENPNVFGILLLPSIKQIKFDPENLKIQVIKQIKELSDKEIEKKGWIKSKSMKKWRSKIMAKKVMINFISNMVKIVLFILIVINFYILFEIKNDISSIETDVNVDLSSLEYDVNSIKDEISSISLYDIESNINDIYSLIQEIESDVSNISLYDIESNLDDVYSTIQNIESDINSIKDNIGGEYDYGTILYKLREIEDK